jgi:hypothetical protein
VLDHLPDGPARILALAEADPSHPSCIEACEIGLAAPDHLELRLDAARTLRGSALDADGRPLEGATVVLRESGDSLDLSPESDGRREAADRSTRTDAAGCFDFPHCDGWPVRLFLLDDGVDDVVNGGVHGGVHGGVVGVDASRALAGTAVEDAREPVLLRAAGYSTGSLRGRLAEAGRERSLLLCSDALLQDLARPMDDTAGFVFDGLLEGTYRLYVQEAGDVPVLLRTLRVHTAEHVDLGFVDPPDPRAVQLVFPQAQVPPIEHLSIHWRKARFPALQTHPERIERNALGYRTAPLQPGEYELVLTPEGYQPKLQKFTLEAVDTGEDAVVEVRLARADVVRLELWTPPPTAERRYLHIEVLGEPPFELQPIRWMLAGAPMVKTLRLLPGDYEVRAWIDEGPAATRTIRVPESHGGEPLVFPLNVP